MADEEKPEEPEAGKVTPEDPDDDDAPAQKSAEVVTPEKFAKYAETIKHEKTAANLRREVSTRKRLQDRYNRLLEESCAFEDLSIAQADQLNSIRSQLSKLQDDLGENTKLLSSTKMQLENDISELIKKWKSRLIFLSVAFVITISLVSACVIVAYRYDLIKFGTLDLENPK